MMNRNKAKGNSNIDIFAEELEETEEATIDFEKTPDWVESQHKKEVSRSRNEAIRDIGIELEPLIDFEGIKKENKNDDTEYKKAKLKSRFSIAKSMKKASDSGLKLKRSSSRPK